MFDKNTKKPVRVPAALTLESSHDLPAWVYAKSAPETYATTRYDADVATDDILTRAEMARLKSVIRYLNYGE
jgi:hypothetical protein